MFATLVLLAVSQAAKPTESPVDQPKAKTESKSNPADVEKKKSADSPTPKSKEEPQREKAPVRLRRRDDARSTDAQKKSNDDAPAVESRNIPSPGTPAKKSDLDEQLLRELGQGLESAKEDESDPLLRAQRRMRKVEEELAGVRADDRTIDVQKKIIADLDELLAQAANQNQRQQQQKQSQKRKQNQQQKNQSQANSQQKNNQRNQGKQEGQDPANRLGAARNASEQRGTAVETKDIWGHLSKLDRQELVQYARESFLPKYREMLEQYYTTIATKSRSKSE